MATRIHNNEAIASIALSRFIESHGDISFAKAMVVLPFLLHPEMVSFLKHRRTVIRSLEELIVKKGDILSNFNGRFNELLPVAINSLYILSEAKKVELISNRIIHRQSINSDVSRINDINQAIPALKQILNEETESIYLKLRIQL